MRSPGVIYRRYRQMRKKFLYDKLEQARVCSHSNCHYGKVVSYADEQGVEHSIKMCNYNTLLEKGRIEICTNPSECNAYVNKWTKDRVVEAAEKELLDPEVKKRLCPEIAILEWVLDKDLNDAIKNPGFIGSIIIRCIEFLENCIKYQANNRTRSNKNEAAS
jgi:hypothetical protein